VEAQDLCCLIQTGVQVPPHCGHQQFSHAIRAIPSAHFTVLVQVPQQTILQYSCQRRVLTANTTTHWRQKNLRLVRLPPV